MIGRALGGLARAAGRARAWGQARAVVLLYHSIAGETGDPWGLAVAPAHFAQHLEVLRRLATPLPLRELVRRARDGTLPRRAVAVAVTFDDGYADVLHAARPRLADADVPATVFVVTGMLDAPRAFWWDELEALVLRGDAVPAALELELAGARRRWELAPAPDGLTMDAGAGSVWRAWDAPRTARQALFVELWRALHASGPAERERVLTLLRAWRGHRGDGAPARLPLTTSELRALLDGGLVTVGAHTVTHPSLAALPLDEQRTEIRGSAERLASAAGATVHAFAYPFGRPSDVSPATVSLVREAGFEAACVNVTGVVTGATDPLELPRLMVADMDGEAFERRLHDLLVGARQR